MAKRKKHPRHGLHVGIWLISFVALLWALAQPWAHAPVQDVKAGGQVLLDLLENWKNLLPVAVAVVKAEYWGLSR